MAAGYRSNAARWIGGASSILPTTVAGTRSVCARWLGGASSYTGPARPGYRSLLAYWLGGASSYPYIPQSQKSHTVEEGSIEEGT